MRSIARTRADSAAWSTGFRQVIVAAAFQPRDDIGAIRLGGDQDHRDERQRGVGLQPLDGFDAVHLWHHDVEQDEIGQQLPGFFQRLDTVPGGHDLIALAFEAHLQDVDIVRHIVDDKDQRRLAHR